MLRVDSKNHMLLDRKGIILVKQGNYHIKIARKFNFVFNRLAIDSSE
jgi:hypothetical protein